MNNTGKCGRCQNIKMSGSESWPSKLELMCAHSKNATAVKIYTITTRAGFELTKTSRMAMIFIT